VVVIAVLDGGDGAGPARRFAAAGATGLLLADPRPGVAEDIAAALDRTGCPVVGVSSDIHQPSDIAALVDTCEKHLGRIDLFCVAGPDGERVVALDELPGDLDRLAELLYPLSEAIGELLPSQRAEAGRTAA
jgi:NAD(P)-dependent dehydrogenase (short-subunit alcohol dehydrogenase family)